MVNEGILLEWMGMGMGMLGVRLWWILLFSQVEKGGGLATVTGRRGGDFFIDG